MSVQPTPPTKTADRAPAAWRAHRALLRAKRLWPLEAKCLQTALAMQAMLRRRGLDAPVRIGVRSEDGALRAHAWVELGPYTLDDGSGGEGFDRLPGTAARAGAPAEGTDRP